MKNQCKKLVLTGLVGSLLSVLNLFAQAPDILWTKTIGGLSDDRGFAVQQTTDGGFIIVGGTNSFGAGSTDVWLIKTNPQGDTTWTKTYGYQEKDIGYSVQQTLDGGYIITGETWSSGDYPDVYLIKTDSNGDTLWTKTIGGWLKEVGYSVQQTTDGGYIVVGETFSFDHEIIHLSDVYLIKTDSNGDTLWTRNYGKPFWWDEGFSVRQTYDGGYIIVGRRADPFGETEWDVYILRTSSDGYIKWEKTYGGPKYDIARSVQQTPDGGYIITGFTGSTWGKDTSDVFLMRLDKNGDTLWTKTYGGPGDDKAFSVYLDTDGGFIIAGKTNSFGAGSYDVYIIKTDSDGNVQWTKTIGGSGDDVGFSLIQSSDGGYIVAGYTNSFGAGNDDVYLIKIIYPTIILLWPNQQGITIDEGKTYYVRYNGEATSGIKKVTAWLSPDGGQTWTDFIGSRSYLAQPTQVSDDSIEWYVSQQPTNQGRVKVILEDANGLTVSDVSDYNFTLRPAAPTNLTLSSDEKVVYVSWNDNSSYEDGYELWYREDNGSWNTINLPANTTQHTIELEPYHNYTFKVRAKKGSIYSSFTGEKSIYVKLNPPSNLTLNTSSPYNSVSLQFMDNSKYEDRYEIKRLDLIDGYNVFTIQGDASRNELESFNDKVASFRDYEYKVYLVYNNLRRDSISERVTCAPLFYADNNLATGYNYTSKIWRDRSGNLYIAYRLKKYVVFGYSSDGGYNWELDSIFNAGSGFKIYDVSMGLSSNGTPFVIFVEDSSAVSRLWYMIKNGGGWSSFKLDTVYFNKGAGIMEPFILVKEDTVHVVYGKVIIPSSVYDSVYYSKFYYSNPSEFSANKKSVDVFSGNYISNRGSLIFHNGVLNLVFEYNRFTGSIKHYKRVNGNWVDLDTVALELPSGHYPLLSLLNNKLISFVNMSEDPGYPMGFKVYIWNSLDGLQYWYDTLYIPGYSVNSVYSSGRDVYVFCDSSGGKGYLFRFFEGSDGINYEKRFISGYGGERGFKGVVWGGMAVGDREVAFINTRGNSNVVFKRYTTSFVGGEIQILTSGITSQDISPNSTKRIESDVSGNLHFVYSRRDSVFDILIKESKISGRFYLGIGKNPAISKDSIGNLYCVWSYNDTTGLEELRFSKYTGNGWTEYVPLWTSTGTYFWGIGAPSFDIFGEKGYVAWEGMWGPTYHAPPGYLPTDIRLWAGKILMLLKFNLNNPDSTDLFFTHFVSGIRQLPIKETLHVAPREFYDTLVPKLLSPSIVLDNQGKIHLVWDGVNDSLRYYYLSPDTSANLITLKNPTGYYIFEPHITKSNSQIIFKWVERSTSSSSILSKYTFQGIQILSQTEDVYTQSEQLAEPFISRNYITFVKKVNNQDELVYGENVSPFEENILYSASSIRSPQIYYDRNKKTLHFTFYAGDSIYTLYYTKVPLKEDLPVVSLNLGRENPEPITVYREGSISYGEEPYKTLDYGDSLIYEVPLIPKSLFKLHLEAFSPEYIKEKVYVNGIPIGNWHIRPDTHSVFEKIIPQSAIDSVLRIRIEKKKGEKAVVGVLKIYLWKETGGGPQAAETERVLKFDIKFPTILDKNKVFLEIPEKGKVKLRIFDVSGRKRFHLEEVFKKGIHAVNIPELKTGIYFIKAELNGKRKIKKILKIR